VSATVDFCNATQNGIYVSRLVNIVPTAQHVMTVSQQLDPSMEQATDGAETAAIDGLVSSRSETISVSFCLRAPGYGLTL